MQSSRKNKQGETASSIAYAKLRKPTAPASKSHKDKSKYNRKPKHKENYHG